MVTTIREFIMRFTQIKNSPFLKTKHELCGPTTDLEDYINLTKMNISYDYEDASNVIHSYYRRNGIKVINTNGSIFYFLVVVDNEENVCDDSYLLHMMLDEFFKFELKSQGESFAPFVISESLLSYLITANVLEVEWDLCEDLSEGMFQLELDIINTHGEYHVSFGKRDHQYVGLGENIEIRGNVIYLPKPDLTQCGDVESNPGPSISIDRKLITSIRFDGNRQIILETSTGKMLMAETGKYEETENSIIFQTATEQEIMQIQQSLALVPRQKSENYRYKNMQTRRISGNMRNFNPSLRIILKIQKHLQGMWPVEESEGVFGVIQKSFVIPQNLIRVKFGKIWYGHNNINSTLVNEIIASVRNQEMTDDQLFELAIRLTTVEMLSRKQGTGYTEIMADFYNTFRRYVQLLNKQATVNKFPEALKYFYDNEAWIPSRGEIFGNPIELFSYKNRNYPQEHASYDNVTSEIGEFKIPESRQEMLKCLKHGILRSQTKIIDNRWSFQQEDIPFRFVDYKTDLNIIEKFVSDFIDDRIYQGNVMESMIVALEKVEGPEFWIIAEKLTKMTFLQNYNDFYMRSYKAARSKIDVKNVETMSNGDLISKIHLFPTERTMLFRMQLEFQRWTRIFGSYSIKPVYRSFSSLRDLIYHRNSFAEKSMGIWNDLKEKISGCKDVVGTLIETKDTLKEVNECWTKHKVTIQKYLGVSNDLEFSNFRSTYTSVIEIVNVIFRDFVHKIGEWIGIDVQTNIDGTTAFMYYILWMNTDNFAIRYGIILDILTRLGIFDLIIKAVRSLYTLIMGEKDAVGDFDEVFKQMKDEINEKETVFTVVRAEIKPEEDINMFEKILGFLHRGSHKFIGLAVVALMTALGIKYSVSKKDQDTFGINIVSAFKNISILSAGLAAMPKIYETILIIFNGVVDTVRGIADKNYKNKINVEEDLKKWLKGTYYFVGNIDYVLVHKPEISLDYMKMRKLGLEILKNIDKLSRDSRIIFQSRWRDFDGLHEKIRTAIGFAYAAPEMIHICLSGTAGAGKTDSNSALRKSAEKGLQSARNKIKRKITDDEEDVAIHPVPYYMNETLRHMDGYNGNDVLVLDDSNLFSNPDQVAIITQLLMISGNPTIAQMANLSEKGRLISASIMISNTNTPYPKIEKFNCDQALWRRRLLIGTELQEGVNNTNGENLNEKIDNWCSLNKKSRTHCEHLRYSILIATDETGTTMQCGTRKMENMTLEEISKFVELYTEKHFLTQFNRGLERDGIYHLIGEYFRMIMNKADQTDQSVSLRYIVDTLEKYSQASDDDIEQIPLIEVIKTLPDNKIAINHKELRKEFANVAQFTKSLTKSKPDNETMNLIKATKSMNRYIPYVLHRVNGIYKAVPSKEPSIVLDGQIKTEYLKVSEDGVCQFIYCGPELSITEAMVVLGFLADNFDRGKEYLEAKMKKFERIRNDQPFYTELKSEIRLAYTHTIQYVSQIGRTIKNFILDYISQPFLTGLTVAIGLIGMFFSCAMIGQLLSPKLSNQYYKEQKKPLAREPVHSRGVYNVDVEDKVRTSVSRVYTHNSTFIITGYEGNLWLTNWHCVEEIKTPINIIIADNRTEKTKSYVLYPKDIKKVKGHDLALINLGNHRPTKSLSKNWVTKEDVEEADMNFRTTKCKAIIMRDEDSKTILSETKEGRRMFIDSDYESLWFASATNENKFVMNFNSPARLGDSGSPVIHDNDRLHGKILGLVTRTNHDLGYAQVVIASKQDIDEVAKTFDFKSRIVTNFLETPEITNHPIHSVFKYGQVVKESPYPNQAVSFLPGFIKSPIYGSFSVETQPAIQHGNDSRIIPGSRHHLEVSLNKTAGFKSAKFTHAEKEWMEKYLYKVYHRYFSLRHLRLYTTAQAITGIKAPGSKSIEVNTCAGLPYKCNKGVVGKKPYIMVAPDGTWKIQQSVFDDVRYFEEYYSNLRVPPNVKIEFRKHELVGENKIIEPKTRTVGMGNFVHQIVYNKFTKDLFLRCKNIWEEGKSSPFALGVDPERHWHQIAEHLRYHDYVCDFDVKAWEEKVDQVLLQMTTNVKLRIVKESMQADGLYFDPAVERIAHGLVVDFIHADVQYEDFIYEKKSGLLSGHPGTFMENTEIHEMILALAVKRVMEINCPSYVSIPYIMDNIRSIKAADDIVVAISPQARKWITFEDIVKEYNNIGYELTAPDKSEKISAKSLFEAQFLKHKFVKREFEIQALPNESMIYQLTNWIRTNSSKANDQTRSQFNINCEASIRFAYWHGEEFYEAFVKKLNHELSKRDILWRWEYDYQEMIVIMKRSMDESRQDAMRIPINEKVSEEFYEDWMN